MKRRSKVSSERAKARRPKATKLKRRNEAIRPTSSSAEKEGEVARLTRELNEAREQQTATSEVLQVISSFAGELDPVFQAILENATRICEAKFGALYLNDGDGFRATAMHNAPPAYEEARAGVAHPPPSTTFWRAANTKQAVQIADVRLERGYIERDPFVVSAAALGGYRSVLSVPMLHEDRLVGVITIFRQEVRPFTDKQIELVKNFAAEAVIAIENARLLNELRQSLEQQTATSEVLQVISASPGDLEPVFATMLGNAARICDAKFGNIFHWDGNSLCLVATHNTPPAFAEYRKRRPLPLKPNLPFSRMVEAKAVVHCADAAALPAYTEQRDPDVVAAVELGGIRTFVAVPMLKEDKLIGALIVYRQDVRSFTDKQIELVKNFAAQAVIAIENARLLNELRQSLEQQTATSEVLQVISSSPGDLQPVFTTMLEKAVRISDAKFGTLYLYEEGGLRLIAAHDVPAAFEEVRGGGPIPPAPGSLFDEVIKTGTTVHLPDMAATTPYAEGHPRVVEAVELGGIRTVVAVPMLKENELIGIISIHRREVRPFTDKQIALVTNFAAQAVIAIENARLLNELRQRTTDLTEALEQQTATSNVLQVISSSPGNLEPVFATMLENAVRLCDAKFGSINRWDGEALHLVATYNVPPDFAEFRKRTPFRPGPENPISRMLMTKTVIHFHDLATEQGYIERNPTFVAAVELGGVRTFLAVPMLKENDLIGVVIVYRQEVRPFGDKQIEVIKNFAAQAVIAIENARLLNELRERTNDLTGRTADLTEALEQQTATSEVLQAISSSPGNLEPVFATMLEKAVRICDATFGNIYRWDGEALHLLATHNTPPAFADARKRSPRHPSPNTLAGRMVATKTAVHVADLAAEEAYVQHRDAATVASVELGGVRTFLAVPMLKDDELIGTFALARQEVCPFTDKQIALVENFAAQAVIAIENARLLNELRQRTDDLTEALEQQTATSDLLQVISGSPGNLEPVFQAMLENAVGICGANFGNMFLYEDDAFRTVAMFNAPEAYANARMGAPLHPPSDSGLGRLVATKEVVQIADLSTVERYVINRDPFVVAAVELAGIRTLLAVPMLKEGRLVGAIVIYRQEVRPFGEKQTELVKNFASQVVIAIENARLLNELRQRTTDLSQRTTDLTEALEQQTATRDVLEVISRSAFDLQAVFETVAESSVRLCGADRAFIFRFDGELLRMVVAYNSSPDFVEWVANHPIRPGRHSGSARAALERRTIHVPDVLADPEYTYGAKDVEPIRTILGVPILKGDDLLGVMMIYRLEVRPFTDRQISLVETFADQAAIAIENVRLLDELRERTEEVEKLNQHLGQRVADQVGEIERMSRLRRFLPPQVADLIVASGSEKQLESHRREITALFCDLRGFTGFSESADPEDVMTLLREYHEAIGASIIKYSGTLERYAGDGVMVVFNDPVPVENPALQAVLMALEMRDAIGALTETWRRWGHDIGFGIGIAHGFATLGTIGFEGRFDYAAIGTVSNVASRLCDEAKPGQILISPRVLTKVENAVKVEPVGEFELKGIRRPLAAYNVVGAIDCSI